MNTFIQDDTGDQLQEKHISLTPYRCGYYTITHVDDSHVVRVLQNTNTNKNLYRAIIR